MGAAALGSLSGGGGRSVEDEGLASRLIACATGGGAGVGRARGGWGRDTDAASGACAIFRRTIRRFGRSALGG
jgi:hypothetical protein